VAIKEQFASFLIDGLLMKQLAPAVPLLLKFVTPVE